ncbi:hypothetical protein F2P56_024225 [Juglans regia]|uniref:Uncharacterized protein n=1 Tax=Juglans regia TaxID=51240 RepID=A0A833X9C1_JUGRE|nr:hypothetical protein F2P56_024225 [Juglans regia]
MAAASSVVVAVVARVIPVVGSGTWQGTAGVAVVLAVAVVVARAFLVGLSVILLGIAATMSFPGGSAVAVAEEEAAVSTVGNKDTLPKNALTSLDYEEKRVIVHILSFF